MVPLLIPESNISHLQNTTVNCSSVLKKKEFCLSSRSCKPPIDHGVNCTSGGITCVTGLFESDFIEHYSKVDYCRSCIYIYSHHLWEIEFCRKSATASIAESTIEAMAVFSPLSCKCTYMYTRIYRRKIPGNPHGIELLLFLLTSLMISKEKNKLVFKVWIKLESHLLNYRKIVIIHFVSVRGS